MLQVIVDSVTSLDDIQIYLLYLTYMDKSSILCEVKCPLILLLRRDPLEKFRNVLKMKKGIRSLAKPLIHLSKFKFDFTKKILIRPSTKIVETIPL